MIVVCGLINQTIFAHDVERFVIASVFKRGSFTQTIVVGHRGGLRTFRNYSDFVRCGCRVRNLAAVSAYGLKGAPRPIIYGISIVGVTSLRIAVLWFEHGINEQPTITRRTVSGLCLPRFKDDVGDN